MFATGAALIIGSYCIFAVHYNEQFSAIWRTTNVKKTFVTYVHTFEVSNGSGLFNNYAPLNIYRAVSDKPNVNCIFTVSDASNCRLSLVVTIASAFASAFV